MLVEIAVGDAYASGFEYVTKEFMEENHRFDQYVAHPKWGLAPGSYTDDTQMSIAVAECVLKLLEGEAQTREDFTFSFINAFKRDQRKSYAQGFYDFLCSVKDTEDFLARIKPHSEKSGAAMRTSTVGLLPTIRKVKKYASLQASVTHDTFLGKQAAVAAALAVHYVHILKGEKRGLGDFLDKEAKIEKMRFWSLPWEGQIKAPGWHSVRAAVYAFTEFDTLTQCLDWIIRQRGDTDTAGAICMSFASLSPEIENDIPQCLYDGLENGQFGRDYLIELDRKLGTESERIRNA